jgi:hypothetical protein
VVLSVLPGQVVMHMALFLTIFHNYSIPLVVMVKNVGV